MTTRRQFITGAAILGGSYAGLRYGVPALIEAWRGLPAPEPLSRPPGFRTLPRSDVSLGLNPMIGLDPTPARDVSPGILQGRLCEALFGLETVPPGVVPIATFSDYNCPFCRVLTPRLQDLEAGSENTIRVKWHELPILGPASAEAARAALAAGQQGRYAEAHARLIRSSFRPSEAYLRGLSEDLDLNADRLLRDMHSPEITAALEDSRALAQLFAMVGTPALVVGRTLVQGAISARTLKRLIELERTEGAIPGCA